MLINLICIALYASWPGYIHLFLNSALHNPDVRFTIVTNLNESHPSWHDAVGNFQKPSNVVFARYSFEEVVALIRRDNLGLGPGPLAVPNPYKLIDYKPMYGAMFSRELRGFTHWGWFDLDIVVGDIRREYGCNHTGEDFLSYDHTPLHGPLMVNRNTELVTSFYLHVLSRPAMLASLGKG